MSPRKAARETAALAHSGAPELPTDPLARPEAEVLARARAVEALMVEKGLASSDALDAVEHLYAQELGPHNGARVVARAWIDPSYKRRLLEDGTAAVTEFGFVGAQGQQIVVVENTATVHNLVVCTLCSCYPWPLLGLPPAWYKSHAYRARAVLEPRAVLREFGLELQDEVEVRVWDSTAEVRYLVLPERPSGTDGLDEDQLALLVPAGAMVGTAQARR